MIKKISPIYRNSKMNNNKKQKDKDRDNKEFKALLNEKTNKSIK